MKSSPLQKVNRPLKEIRGHLHKSNEEQDDGDEQEQEEEDDAFSGTWCVCVMSV